MKYMIYAAVCCVLVLLVVSCGSQEIKKNRSASQDARVALLQSL